MRGAVTAVVVIALLVTPACGGEDEPTGAPATGATAQLTGVPPDEWAAEFCGTLRSWADDLAAEGAKLQQAGAEAASVDEARSLMVETFETINARTDVMLAELDDLGAPAVEGGEATAQDLEAEVAKIEPVLEETGARVAELPADPKAFSDGATDAARDMVGQMGVLVGRLETATETFDSPELEQAFAGASTCQGMIG